MKAGIVVPWHNPEQLQRFAEAWRVTVDFIHHADFLYLEQDVNKTGCGATKNRGIRRAIDDGCEVVCVLDDDCFPTIPVIQNDGEWTLNGPQTLEDLIAAHLLALNPQEVELYKTVTNPQSRGTPYYRRTVKMPVAASIGFWEEVPDLCAPAQLVRGPLCPMTFDKRPIFGQAFAYCGMNVAFRAEWWPWCSFADLQRVDDIFAGYLFQREAYRRKHCFNLGGPMIRHSRQSNVWRNLEEEVKYLERNETLWSDVLMHPRDDYMSLCALLPEKR